MIKSKSPELLNPERKNLPRQERILNTVPRNLIIKASELLKLLGYHAYLIIKWQSPSGGKNLGPILTHQTQHLPKYKMQ